MKGKIIAQGAEAKIILLGKNIIKNRIPKSYRLKELDEKIRKSRTKAETKLLEKASKIISAPTAKQTEFDKIKMPFIRGEKLSEHLDSLKDKKEVCIEIGKSIAKLHNSEIIHGDLTTSNMILKNKHVYFIDFGLGYISNKLEDKAVDLHLLKQALEAKHFKCWKELWTSVEKGYKASKDSKKVLGRLTAVERRGRYKKGS